MCFTLNVLGEIVFIAYIILTLAPWKSPNHQLAPKPITWSLTSQKRSRDSFLSAILTAILPGPERSSSTCRPVKNDQDWGNLQNLCRKHNEQTRNTMIWPGGAHATQEPRTERGKARSLNQAAGTVSALILGSTGHVTLGLPHLGIRILFERDIMRNWTLTLRTLLRRDSFVHRLLKTHWTVLNEGRASRFTPWSSSGYLMRRTLTSSHQCAGRTIGMYMKPCV